MIIVMVCYCSVDDIGFLTITGVSTHRGDHVKVVINSPTPLRLQRKSSLGCNLQKRDKNNYTVTMQILYNLYTGVDVK